MMAQILLQKIEEEELPSIEKYLIEKLPGTILEYNILSLHLKKGTPKSIPLKVYKAKSSEAASALIFTPVSTEERLQSATLHWEEEKVSDDFLLEVLKHLPGFQWNRPSFFRHGSLSRKDKVDTLIEKHLLDPALERLKDPSERGVALIFSEEEFQIPKIPSHYSIDRIPPSASDFLRSKWEFHSESKSGFKELITSYPAYGVFSSVKPEEETFWCEHGFLVSWVMQQYHGFMAARYTLPSERGKKLSLSAYGALAAEICGEGRIASCSVDDHLVGIIKSDLRNGFKKMGTYGESTFFPIGTKLEEFVKLEFS